MKINKLILGLLLTLFFVSTSQAKELPLKPVKINTASQQELLLLPGVGEKRASEIMAVRLQKPILNESDLLAVKGIGEKTLITWKGLIDYSVSDTDISKDQKK